MVFKSVNSRLKELRQYGQALASAMEANLEKDKRSKDKSSFIPESAIYHVEQSWELLEERKEDVGVEFFVRLFDEFPQLLKMFPFSQEVSSLNKKEFTVTPKAIMRSPMVRSHARLVMTAVGNTVAGLSNVEELVPSLRKLGHFHSLAGIQPEHYEVFFRLLLDVVGDFLPEESWTEETKDAWKTAGFCISTVMKRPNDMLAGEALGTWNWCMIIGSTYQALATPFRLAGFVKKLSMAGSAILVMDVWSALCFAVDYFWFGSQPAHGRWTNLDIIVLVSYLLEFVFAQGKMFSRSNDVAAVGLHWAQLFGLMRLCTVVRTLQLQNVEHRLVIKGRMDKDKRSWLSISKILVTLAYVTHVFACLYCIVYRVQVGAGVHSASDPTAFFSDPTIIHGGSLNAYLKATHWAWVSLAGFGNHSSTPDTSAECLFVLMVHFVGATLYAVVTGNVVHMLETLTEKENEITQDLTILSDMMQSYNFPRGAQERIMQGYVMRNMSTAKNGNITREETDLALVGGLADKLPVHLKREIRLYSRANEIGKRDLAFSACSESFLCALVNDLRNTISLLPGDVLVMQGEESLKQVYFVESGTLAVTHDGKSVAIIHPGDVLGKSWLLANTEDNTEFEKPPLLARMSSSDSFSSSGSMFDYNEEWPERAFAAQKALVSIRAMERCTLSTGLVDIADVRHLNQRYPESFEILRNSMNAVDRVKRKIH